MNIRRALLAAFFLVAAPPSALAFECTSTDTSCASDDPLCSRSTTMPTLGWNQRCVPFYIREDDPLFGSSLEGLVTDAFGRWSSDLACTDLELLFAGYTGDEAGFDAQEPDEQKNVVLSVTEADPELFPDATTLAITLTSYSVESGEIFDADIVFNLAEHAFEVLADGFACSALDEEDQPFDVENTLVHEIGHFVGLDHVGNRNLPVTAQNPLASAATMFGSAQPCETNKRDLTNDDIDGVCAIYPAGGPLSTCVPPASYELSTGSPDPYREQCERATNDGCGCSTTHEAGASRTWTVLMALPLLGVLLASRRRSRA